jgi:hypothetical protein
VLIHAVHSSPFCVWRSLASTLQSREAGTGLYRVLQWKLGAKQKMEILVVAVSPFRLLLTSRKLTAKDF